MEVVMETHSEAEKMSSVTQIIRFINIILNRSNIALCQNKTCTYFGACADKRYFKLTFVLFHSSKY